MGGISITTAVYSYEELCGASLRMRTGVKLVFVVFCLGVRVVQRYTCESVFRLGEGRRKVPPHVPAAMHDI